MASASSSKNKAPRALKTVEHGLSASAHWGRAALRRKRHPQRRAATFDESDRGRADRRRMARPPIAVGGGRRRQTGPGCPPGQALGVEPRSLIALESRRQDLGLPRSCRRLEAFERAQDHGQRVGPFEARLLRDMLPGEQEAQKIARRDRVDLRPQPTNRRMMNARQQAPVAPLLIVEAGEEASLENCAFAFESGEGRCYRARLKPEWRSERRWRDRPKTLEPAA